MIDLLNSKNVEVVNNHKGKRTLLPPVMIWVPAVLVVAVIIFPIGYLILSTIGSGTEVLEILFRSRTVEILTRSLLLVVSVSLGSVFIAVPIGWLTIRTNLPFRRVFSVMTVLPLVIPSYVGGFVFVAVLGPKGMLQQLLDPLGVERLPDLFGFPGAMLTLTLLTYPYVLLPVRAALSRLDQSLDETSHSLGKDSRQTFLRVTLPMLRPAIATGVLLVALYTLSDFGAVSLLHYETFTWAIYVQYGNFARDVAASLSLVLVVVAIAILIMETWTRGKAAYYRSATGVERPQRLVKLGNWCWVATLFCGMVVAVSLLIPLAVLINWVARGVSSGEQVSILWSHLGNAVHVSGFAALVVVVVSMPIAIISVRYPGRISSLLEKCSYIGFALPGIVVALAIVFFGVRYATPLYQTLSLLIFAYLILFLPTALGNIRTSLLQVSPAIEEAARSLGRSPTQAFITVTLPVLIPGILAGAVMVFMLTMKELPATLILSPIGFKTLATSVWWATEDGFFAKAAASSLLLISASLVPMALLVWLGRKEVS